MFFSIILCEALAIQDGSKPLVLQIPAFLDAALNFATYIFCYKKVKRVSKIIL